MVFIVLYCVVLYYTTMHSFISDKQQSDEILSYHCELHSVTFYLFYLIRLGINIFIYYTSLRMCTMRRAGSHLEHEDFTLRHPRPALAVCAPCEHGQIVHPET